MFNYIKKLIVPISCAIGGVIGVKSATYQGQHSALKEAVAEAETLLTEIKDKNGCPGMSVAVSVNGSVLWKGGFGYSDLENNVSCHSDTVMKIASLSKPITMAIIAKSVQEGQLKWDDPVAKYVSYWPQKYWQDEKVDVHISQLASHLSGIRDYKKIASHAKGSDDDQEFSFLEYYIKRRFRSTAESAKLFKDDPLISKPGEEFHYTTHGFTVLAAALEGATQKTFPKLVRQFFSELGMENSHLDKKNKIIYGRAKYYTKNRKGEILNAPFTESSFKWAGAGMLSTAPDLVRFGNVMLYSYQNSDGLLRPETVAAMWTPVAKTSVSWHETGRYGMGWQVIPVGDEPLKCPCCSLKDKASGDVSKLANDSDRLNVGDRSLKCQCYSLKDSGSVNESSGDKFINDPGTTVNVSAIEPNESHVVKDNASAKGSSDILRNAPGVVCDIEPTHQDHASKSNIRANEHRDTCINSPGTFVVGHTGGTIGASAALMILPLGDDINKKDRKGEGDVSVNKNMDNPEKKTEDANQNDTKGDRDVSRDRNKNDVSVKRIWNSHGQNDNQDAAKVTKGSKGLADSGYNKQHNSHPNGDMDIKGYSHAEQDKNLHDMQAGCPKGIVVVVLCNMQGVSLGTLAVEIAQIFRKTIGVWKS